MKALYPSLAREGPAEKSSNIRVARLLETGNRAPTDQMSTSIHTSRPMYAASEFAAALAPFWSKRRILAAFENITPAGRKLVSGNETTAWHVEQAPPEIQNELENRRAGHCCRTVHHWMNNPLQPWQPAVPLSKASDGCVQEATNLRDALAKALAEPEPASVSERARIAAADYKRVFGRGVTERHLRGLITRIMDRDAGLNAWHRLEIYMPENVRPKMKMSSPVASSARISELDIAFASVKDTTNPLPDETAFCWRKIIEYALGKIDPDTPEKRVKKIICDYIQLAAPWLAESKHACKRNLNRKLAIARKDGTAAIVDNRARESGHRRKAPDWEHNIRLMAKWTLACDGRESQAWRELWTGTHPRGEQFTEAFRAYYPFDVRSAKSQVPAIVRHTIQPIMEKAKPRRLGPRATQLAAPAILRDHSDTFAGDRYSSDDITFNHPFFQWDDEGEYEFGGRRFDVGRGQTLLQCDVRTGVPLSFGTTIEKNYNQWYIFTQQARSALDPSIGLPFKGYWWEKNIWEAISLKHQFSWAQLDEGFTRHGLSLNIRHATTPRGKSIERIIGIVQNLNEWLPGNVGRNEVKVKFEKVQKFLGSLKKVTQPTKAEVDPSEMLMSIDQFMSGLENSLRRFSNEPQNGEWLDGISPAEGWKILHRPQPHILLPDSLRYLLTTHRCPKDRVVTSNGIDLDIRGKTHRYCGSERLGELHGEKVCVYYNPELPDHIICIHPRTDPKGLAPFSVPLMPRVPYSTATEEHFAAVRKDQKAFGSSGMKYRLLAPRHNLILQDANFGSLDARNTGEAINRVEREHIELRDTRKKSAGVIKDLASRANLGIDAAKVRKPERVIENLSALDDLEQKIRSMKNQNK